MSAFTAFPEVYHTFILIHTVVAIHLALWWRCGIPHRTRQERLVNGTYTLLEDVEGEGDTILPHPPDPLICTLVMGTLVSRSGYFIAGLALPVAWSSLSMILAASGYTCYFGLLILVGTMRHGLTGLARIDMNGDLSDDHPLRFFPVIRRPIPTRLWNCIIGLSCGLCGCFFLVIVSHLMLPLLEIHEDAQDGSLQCTNPVVHPIDNWRSSIPSEQCAANSTEAIAAAWQQWRQLANITTPVVAPPVIDDPLSSVLHSIWEFMILYYRFVHALGSHFGSIQLILYFGGYGIMHLFLGFTISDRQPVPLMIGWNDRIQFPNLLLTSLLISFGCFAQAIITSVSWLSPRDFFQHFVPLQSVFLGSELIVLLSLLWSTRPQMSWDNPFRQNVEA